jgi:hypothetical protein
MRMMQVMRMVIRTIQAIAKHTKLPLITSLQNLTTMNTPRVSREQAEMLEILNGTDYFADLGKYVYELTLDEAARWLREVKKVVHIIVYYKGGNWTVDFQFSPTIRMLTDVSENTHDLALSAGIDLILKKLNDGH